MPLYTYQCHDCSRRIDAFRKVADRDECPVCPRCSGATFKAVTAAAVVADYPGYNCPITGAWIEGRKAHEVNLAKHGCRVLEAGETSKVDAEKRRADEESYRETEATVGAQIASMGSEERRQLEVAVEHGFTCTTERL